MFEFKSIAFKLCGRQIKFESTYKPMFEIFKSLSMYAEVRYTEFQNTYEAKTKTLDDLENIIIPYLEQEAREGIKYGVKLLNQYAKNNITTTMLEKEIEQRHTEYYDEDAANHIESIIEDVEGLEEDWDKAEFFTDCAEALVDFCLDDVFQTIWQHLENEGTVTETDISTESVRVEEYEMEYEKNKDVSAKLIDAYCDLIQKDPFNTSCYGSLYEVATNEKASILYLAEFVGLKNDLLRYIENYIE